MIQVRVALRSIRAVACVSRDYGDLNAFRVLTEIDRSISFTWEAYADGAGRCGARMRGSIWGSEDREG